MKFHTFRETLVVSRGEVVYSRAEAKCLILCLTKRTGYAIMMERLSVARLKNVDIMFYAIFLKESQF